MYWNNGNQTPLYIPNPNPGVTTVWVPGQENGIPELVNNFGSLSVQHDAATSLPNQFIIPQQTVYSSVGVTSPTGLTSNSQPGYYTVISVKDTATKTKPEIQPLHFPAVDSNINLIDGALQTTLTHQTVMSPARVTQNLNQLPAFVTEPLSEPACTTYVTSPQYITSTIPENGFDQSGPMSTKMVSSSTGEQAETSSINDFSSTASSLSESLPSSMPSSPMPEQQLESPVFQTVAPNYTKPKLKDLCMRCGKKVYAMEKIGPIKEVLYHKLCFRCVVCSSLLNLKSFNFNPNDMEDLNIYCQSHKPREEKAALDASSVSIQKALRVPRLDKVNEQVRGGPAAMRGGKLDIDAVSIKTALNAPKPTIVSPDLLKVSGQAYYFDSADMSMQHVRNVPATDLQTSNKLREKVWNRNERQSESVPPPGVVRYSSQEEDRRSYHYAYEDVPEPDYY